MGKLKRLFRATSPDILKSYFDQKGMKFADDFDWALNAAKLANAIEEALAGLPQVQEDRLGAELELIQEIANADGWVAIDEVCGGCEIDVPEGGGAEGAAFFVALHHAELLPKIANAASMNRYSGGRQWSCYRMEGAQLSSETVSDPDARAHFIEAVLKARNFQVSRPHEIDWFSAVRRDPLTDEKSEITYLTIYLLDRPIQEMTIDQDNRFLMALRQRVDEMIFAFNPRTQEIEVYGKGWGKTA